jgi:hypothetical protein
VKVVNERQRVALRVAASILVAAFPEERESAAALLGLAISCANKAGITVDEVASMLLDGLDTTPSSRPVPS